MNTAIPKITFALLNKPNPQGQRCLYIRAYFKGKYISRSTDIWLSEKEWDQERQKVRKSNPQAPRLNHLLSTYYNAITGRVLKAAEKGLTISRLNAVFCGEKEKTKKNTTDLVEYALAVNDREYRQEKYGYTSWYNKKSNILIFAHYMDHYLRKPRPALGDLNAALFDDYVAYRFSVRGNTSKEAVNKGLVPLYHAIEDAVKNGLVKQEKVAPFLGRFVPVKTVKYSRADKEDQAVKYLTPEEVKRFYDHGKKLKNQASKDIHDIFFFALNACGMRCSDVLTLEWSHIDFDKRCIRKVQVKTKKAPEVEIPLNDRAVEILLRWKARKLNGRFVFNRLPEDFRLDDERRLFMARNAGNKGINNSLGAMSINAGMPFRVTMHTARHTFAVMSIDRGVSLHLLSRLLGHSTVLATEKTYARFLKEKVRDEVRNLMVF